MVIDLDQQKVLLLSSKRFKFGSFVYIVQKCSEKRLSDMPQTYFTFARTIPLASKISKPVMALLQNFGWNRILMIVGRRNEWIQIKDAIQVFLL